MKKIISFLLIGLVLIGCSSNKSSKTNEIRFAIWDINQKPAYEKIASQFNKANPDYKVVVEVTPYKDYWTALDTAAQADNLPDVFTINAPNFLKYQESGKLLDITDLKIEYTDFNEAVQNIYTVDSKRFALARDYDGIGLWYNKDILEKAGVSVPTTYDELLVAAQKIKDSDSSVIPLVIPHYDSQSGYWNLVVQFGGDVITKDNKSGWGTPTTLEVLTFYQDLVTKGLSVKPSQLEGFENINSVASGKVAMMYGGTWYSGEAMKISNKDVIDVAPLPMSSKTDNSSIIHGVATAIASTSKNMDGAKLFLEYLSSDEATNIIATEAGVMPAKNNFGDTVYKSYDFLSGLKATFESSSKGVSYPRANVTGWDATETENITKMLNGDLTPEVVNKTLETDANKVLE
ncbi:MAG: ABC transporter substrate-binding protein [Bacilli bacterium]